MKDTETVSQSPGWSLTNECADSVIFAGKAFSWIRLLLQTGSSLFSHSEVMPFIMVPSQNSCVHSQEPWTLTSVTNTWSSQE